MRTAPLLIALTLQGCALFELAAIRKSHPPLSGERTADVEGDVRIVRDDLAVPHIRATTERDAWFGLGFVHGQDRFFQADLLRHLAFGLTSEWLGEGAVELDVFMKGLQLRARSRELLGRQSPEAQAMMEAYADGMNAGLGTLDIDPIEYRLLNVPPEPWAPEDAYAVLMLQSWNLSENPTWETFAWLTRDEVSASDLTALFAMEPDLPPVESTWETLRQVDAGPLTAAFEAFTGTLGGRPEASEASNNWVIGGERTASGLPILANDPHLSQQVPSLWYIADIAGGDLHVAGATLPGAPGVPLGHTDGAAWGLTNVMADVMDLAVVERVGDRGYVLAGEERTFEEVEVTVQVAGGDAVTRTVLHTDIGPVITELEGTHALVMRWHALEVDDRLPEVLLGMAHSQTVDDLLEALDRDAIVAQNVAMADTTGDYGYQSVGSVPVKVGHTGRVPYDASDPDQGWDGWFPQLPGLRMPDEGYVVTANTRPVVDRHSTDVGDRIDLDGISTSWIPPHRYGRIVQRIEGQPSHTPESVADIQLDLLDLQAQAILPDLLEGVSVDDDGQTCLEALRTWDFRWTADSRGAAVWAAVARQLMIVALRDELSAEALDLYLASTSHSRGLLATGIGRFLDDRQTEVSAAVELGCDDLRDTLGRTKRREERWSWGALHPLALKHPIADGRGILNRWNMPEVPFGGSGTTVAAAGFSIDAGETPVTGMASVRLVVPMADPAAATIVHPGGQSGHPRHPDYDTHYDAFVDGLTLPLRFTEADVDAFARDTLVLVPDE